MIRDVAPSMPVPEFPIPKSLFLKRLLGTGNEGEPGAGSIAAYPPSGRWGLFSWRGCSLARSSIWVRSSDVTALRIGRCIATFGRQGCIFAPGAVPGISPALISQDSLFLGRGRRARREEVGGTRAARGEGDTGVGKESEHESVVVECCRGRGV